MREFGEERLPVGLAIVDRQLQRDVRQALMRDPVLALAENGESARVVITDHRIHADGATLLTIGEAEADSGSGPVLPADEPELIAAAAHVLAAGYRIARGQTREVADAGNDGPAPRLTRREHQVLELLVGGASNKHIANALDISVHTAKFHVTALLEKLGARNRSDAVGIAFRDGHVML